jgi:hypothetical protein
MPQETTASTPVDASSTNPNAPSTDPNTSSTNPDAPFTNPDASSTNPDATSADPDLASVIANIANLPRMTFPIKRINKKTTKGKGKGRKGKTAIGDESDSEVAKMMNAPSEEEVAGDDAVEKETENIAASKQQPENSAMVDTNSKADDADMAEPGNTSTSKKERKKKKPKKRDQLAITHVDGGVAEFDDSEEVEAGRKTPTTEEYEHQRSIVAQQGGVEEALMAIAGSDFDWCRIPEGSWNVRPGAPSLEVKSRLEAIAQGAAFLISTVAAQAGISKSLAWKLTGLLQMEGRSINLYNLYVKKRAAEIRAENGGKPSKSHH